MLSSVLFHNFLIQNTLFFDNKTSYHYNQILLEFPQRFIYESNKTEGSQIPFAQLQLIFQQKQTLHTNKNEIQEVQNSLELWKFLQNDFVFNETHIKKVYHKLTKNLVRNTGDIYPR